MISAEEKLEIINAISEDDYNYISQGHKVRYLGTLIYKLFAAGSRFGPEQIANLMGGIQGEAEEVGDAKTAESIEAYFRRYLGDKYEEYD